MANMENRVQEVDLGSASIERFRPLVGSEVWPELSIAEKRTLLQVRLEDLVQCEEIFSTLMGENVESRRKFIEDNALDVRNLDV